MIKHKRSGFTIVELIVVLVVIAVLVTIAAVSYRSTQADSRDKKRIADAIMLKSAIEEYYSDKGDYPVVSPSCTSPGNSTQCWRNEIWQLLVNQGYLAKVPQPAYTAWSTAYNVAGDGNANYGWYRGSTTVYAIYVPLETHPNKHCKIDRGSSTTLWGSAPTCDF